jgi:1-phosphofructokinase
MGRTIVTLTPNTAIDQVIFLENLELGRTIRAQGELTCVGGKGTDACLVIKELGYSTLALGFVAGETGRKLIKLLEEKGIEQDFIWVEGHTRTVYVLVDRARQAQSSISCDTLKVSPQHFQQLKGKVATWARRSSWIALGGNPPSCLSPDSYAQLLEIAREEGTKTLLDAGGEALAWGLKALPTIVKVNLGELEVMLEKRLPHLSDIKAAAQDMVAQGVELAVVTLGQEGALALTKKEAYRLWPPQVEVVNTAGSGDAVTAGLLVGLSQGQSLPEALRLAMAAAAAVVTTPGTAECHKEDVEWLLPQVRMEPL